jgi:hypothetical protein
MMQILRYFEQAVALAICAVLTLLAALLFLCAAAFALPAWGIVCFVGKIAAACRGAA